MRRRIVLTLALVLSLATTVGVAPSVLAKQEGEIQEDLESSFSEDLTITSVEGDSEQLQAFQVTFAAHAYIPERTYDGAMIVEVQSGTFAFRVQSEILVYSGGDPITVLEADPPIDLGENPDADLPSGLGPDEVGRTFSSIGEVSNCPGMSSLDLCVLDPDELGTNFVQLDPGFIVYLPDGSTCFFCNTAELNAESSLMVWTQPAESEWIQLFEEELGGIPSASPVAQERDSQAALAWAFNPGSRCN